MDKNFLDITGFFTKKRQFFFQRSGFVNSRLGFPSDEKVLKPNSPRKPTFTNGPHDKSAFPALQLTCSSVPGGPYGESRGTKEIHENFCLSVPWVF